MDEDWLLLKEVYKTIKELATQAYMEMFRKLKWEELDGKV